jgi:deazaflavin-dependent oxidoreductase (nitroreductase family)
MSDFDPAVMEAAAAQREVELTTFGRRTGQAHRVTVWISGDGGRLFIRSGGGIGRHWPQNLLARGRGLVRLGGQEVPFVARHLTDPDQARMVSGLVARKYGANVRRSAEGQPLTPGERATFELSPRDAQPS